MSSEDPTLSFNVYRSRDVNGTEVGTLLGATRHIEDAKAILKNWHRGYITQGRRIVHKKNTTE